MASSSFGLLLAAAAAPVVSASGALPGSSLLPVSLAPLHSVSWGELVLVDRLGWEPSSRSILVWLVGVSAPLVCRVGSSPRADVSALVASLRLLAGSGKLCRLGVRGSWSGGNWFCAVAEA